MIKRFYSSTNQLQTVLLLIGMLFVLGLLGFVIAGISGVIWGLVVSFIAFAAIPKLSPALIMRLYRATPIAEEEAPALYAALYDMTERLEMYDTPQLYHVPVAVMNAFTVNAGGRPVIAVTEGLLRQLTFRELVAVLAHEIAHIKYDDVTVMSLADVLGRVTSLFSFVGKVLLVINIPLLLAGYAVFPWWALLLLILAPVANMLMQMSLSRVREYEADALAAMLTLDPLGLASALRKIEFRQSSVWDKVFSTGHNEQEPSYLRTHPLTEDRVEELTAMAERRGMQQPRYKMHNGSLVNRGRVRLVRPVWWRILW